MVKEDIIKYSFNSLLKKKEIIEKKISTKEMT